MVSEGMSLLANRKALSIAPVGSMPCSSAITSLASLAKHGAWLGGPPKPCNSDYKGIIRIILGSCYIPNIPLLQGGGSS